jgi:hypothetical protein
MVPLNAALLQLLIQNHLKEVQKIHHTSYKLGSINNNKVEKIHSYHFFVINFLTVIFLNGNF